MVKTPASGRSRQRRDPAAPSQPDGEPPLSRARIAAAAIAILDAEGLDGLSMRKLADRLDAGVMSLYWHVANKDALLDLALDAVLALPKQPAATGPAHSAPDWREDILEMADDWRAAMLAHPWSAALLPSRTLGPNILARLERLATALARAGVPEADINAAIWSVWNHVMGATVTRASFAGLPAGADHATAAPAQPGSHPTISRTRLLMDDDWDGAFRKGLGFLLDGLSPSR